MNDSTATSAPGASLIPDGTSIITTLHFAILAVLAVLVVLGIIWGMRLKRRRRSADRAIEAHNEEIAAVDDIVAPGSPDGPDARQPDAPVPDAPVPDAPVPDARVALDDEPIAAAAPLDANPAGEASEAIAPSLPASGFGNAPVTTLKGLGPKVAARLGELGVTTVGQLAALDDDAAARLDAQLGSFTGRMGRDRWLEQARFLAAGDKPGFEAVFGRV